MNTKDLKEERLLGYGSIDKEFKDYEVQMDILGSEYVSNFHGDELEVYEIVEELAKRKERIAELTRTVAKLTDPIPEH